MQLTQKWLNKILSRCRKEGDCLIWTGYKNYYGYGYTSRNKKGVALHRLIYIYFKGPIPDGLEIDHVRARGCHSRACLNIEHMEAVTQGVNVLRGDGPPAQNARKIYCSRGHRLDMIDKNGWRRCRTCYNHRMREYNRRRKANPL